MAYGDEGYGRLSGGASGLNAATGALIAAFGTAILVASVRLRWLTSAGALVAALIGIAIGVGSGAAGLGMLVFFFVSSSALTRCLRPRPREGADPAVDSDGSGRSAAQVLANGGVAAAASLTAVLSAGWTDTAMLISAGAISAATADTWSSEIGQWRGGRTRLITTWAPVGPGANGGVSLAGTLAGVLGAAALGGVAAIAFEEASLWLPLTAAGVVGTLTDSVLGASLEDRRRYITNDVVNLVATAVGGLTAAVLI